MEAFWANFYHMWGLYVNFGWVSVIVATSCSQTWVYFGFTNLCPTLPWWIMSALCAPRKKTGFVLHLNWVWFNLNVTPPLVTAGKPQLTTKQRLACLYSWPLIKECVFHWRKKKTLQLWPALRSAHVIFFSATVDLTICLNVHKELLILKCRWDIN